MIALLSKVFLGVLGVFTSSSIAALQSSQALAFFMQVSAHYNEPIQNPASERDLAIYYDFQR
jgi:hypothetical protein